MLGLMLVVFFACKLPPDSDPPPPPPGGVRIDVTGYPANFFNGRTCNYAIYKFGGDLSTAADRVADGTISLSSGSGISAVENLEAGQYDLYVAIDVDSDGYTFRGGHPYPSDGDLHGFETNVTVNNTVIDRYLTLKAVTGTITWSPASSGTLYVDIFRDNTFPRGIEYSGISSATSATYCIDVTDLSGSYYLLGTLDSMIGWYAGADGSAGPPPPPPVDLDDLNNIEDSYDFGL